MKQDPPSTKPAWDNINKHITPHARANNNTPFHHKQPQPLQCSHRYCHVVDQLLHHPMFNIWKTLFEYKFMKCCLLQYQGTWELDPVLISPILQFLRNWGYTQLPRSSIKQFQRSKSTTKVLAAAQNTWNLSSTTVIGVGGEPYKDKEAEEDIEGFNQRDGTHLMENLE